jgi:hypothetical protein
MEGLSLLLKKARESGQISGIKVSTFIKIVHILFVDDVFIVNRGSIEEWRLILSVNLCFL